MENFENYIKIIASLTGGALAWFFGGFDGIIKVLVVFAIIDYITGIIEACTTNTLSSKIGFAGIFKKFIMFLLVGVANIIDIEVLKNSGNVLRTALIFFYISNEGISILENAAALNLPVPEFLKNVLDNIGKDKDKEN